MKSSVAPLQIGRPILSNPDFFGWFVACGFDEKRIPSLHATVAYSRAPVDWNVEPFLPRDGELRLTDTKREIRIFGGSHVVLTIPSASLSERWRELTNAGASWDFDDYVPHVSLGDPNDLSGKELVAFMGPIVLGGEYRRSANA